MPIWPALLLAPALALTEQSIAFALSTPACETQNDPWLHLLPLAFAAATLVFTAMAAKAVGRLRRAGAALPHADAGRRSLRAYFLACVAVGSGALSTLAILAMWVPQWCTPACSG